MKPSRMIDVIDVNRRWGVWVGSRRHGYLVGVVRAPDYRSAMTAARAAHPATRIGFLEEDRP